MPGAAQSESRRPPYILIPNGSDDTFTLCYFNPKTGRYNKDCRDVPKDRVHSRLVTEMNRASAATLRYPVDVSDSK